MNDLVKQVSGNIINKYISILVQKEGVHNLPEVAFLK